MTNCTPYRRNNCQENDFWNRLLWFFRKFYSSFTGITWALKKGQKSHFHKETYVASTLWSISSKFQIIQSFLDGITTKKLPWYISKFMLTSAETLRQKIMKNNLSNLKWKKWKNEINFYNIIIKINIRATKLMNNMFWILQ